MAHLPTSSAWGPPAGRARDITGEVAVRKETEKRLKDLKQAIARIETLNGLIPHGLGLQKNKECRRSLDPDRNLC